MRDPKSLDSAWLAALLWFGACGAGFVALTRYQGTPGPAAVAARWPAASALRRAPGGDTLVLFIHPHCPCTRASVDSLAWIMARGSGRLSAYAVFYRPKGFPEGWERTDLWRDAEAIPGVTAVADIEGREAVRFGAETSGQTFLFDGAGGRLFAGGVTGARGHYGDNPGRSAVRELVAGRPAAESAPVFGCLLLRAVAEREPPAPRRGHG